MKHSKKISAGMLSAAVLLQNFCTLPGIPVPAAPVLTAAAYSVQTNEPRAFTYDFSAFKALYDVRTKQWFTEAGAYLRSGTKRVQQMTAQENNSMKLTLDFDEKTASVSSGGAETDCSSLFRNMLFDPLADIRPEYDTAPYYDKAQQKYIPLPEPESFPLTFVCNEQFRNSAPAALECSIRFGEYEYGTCGISMAGDLFAEEPGGSVNIQTASALQAKATVTPCTVAGDTNFDGAADIADAVLTCRVIAEDITARITDIGRVLADQNCDDRLDASDINDILYNIAHVPYEKRVPTGTVPVISVETCSMSDFQEIFAGSRTGFVDTLTKQVPGEQYDTWYIAGTSYSSEDDMRPVSVRSVMLTAKGTLKINTDVSVYSGDGNVMIAVKVPHNALPSDTRGEIEYHYLNMETLPPYTPDIRYIAVEQPPENTVPVIQIEQPSPRRAPEHWNEMAQIFGYADGDALTQMLMSMDVNYTQMEHCTEGEAVDVWDFAFFGLCAPDTPKHWEEAVLEDLILEDDHSLRAITGLYEYLDSQVNGEDYLWFRVTVPHGALPADTSIAFAPEPRYRNSRAEKAASARYIKTDYPAETVGLACHDYFFSGLSEGVYNAPDDVIAELEEPGTWYASRMYTDPEQMPEAEKTWLLGWGIYDYLTLYFKTPADEKGGYCSEFAVESAQLVSGVLTVHVAEYRPFAQEDIPAHYDRLRIDVPKDGLKDMTEVRVVKTPYFDSVKRYASDSEEKPNEHAVRASDGIWYWEQEDLQRDKFLAAAKPDEAFYITGDALPESYSISAPVSVSVVDYLTGEALPGCMLAFQRTVRTYDGGACCICSDIFAEFETTVDEPVQTLTLSAARFNCGYHPKEESDFAVYVGKPMNDYGYFFKVAMQEFDIPDDGSPVNIVFYAYRHDPDKNVHFTVRDQSRSADEMQLEEPEQFWNEISRRTPLKIYGQDGKEYTAEWHETTFDCQLPDGTYTAKFANEGVNYSFAGSDTVTFTVKDGIADQPEYFIDLIQKTE